MYLVVDSSFMLDLIRYPDIQTFSFGLTLSFIQHQETEESKRSQIW